VDVTAILFYLFHGDMEIQTCHKVFAASTYFVLIGAVVAEIILSMRTHALWKGSRVVLMILIALNLCTLIPAMWITHLSVNALEFVSSPLPALVPCVFSGTQSRAKEFISFVLLMLLDALTTVLAVLSAVNHWRNTNNPLIRTLWMDGVFYFVCLLSISCVNVAIFSVETLNIYYDLAVELQRVLHGILSARIILNVRKVAAGTRGWTDFSFTRSSRRPGSMAIDGEQFDIALESHRIALVNTVTL